MRVLTVTANLLAETTYTFDRWSDGDTQRAREETFQVGGKGINVTRMLTRFGVESEALLFPGGATGLRCESWLREAAIPHRAFRTPAETRTGAVVRTPGRPETTFLGVENDVDAEAIRACARHLGNQPAEAVIALSGSIPAWNDARWDPLRNVIENRARTGRVYIDTYGPPLGWFAKLGVSLIKINRREFAGLAGEAPDALTEEKMPRLLKKFARDSRPRAWIVTDGPNPVWCATPQSDPVTARPPAIEEISQTGSGDVFMASLIHALEVQQLSLGDAVKFALPIATANAASPGVADFDLRPFGFQ